jgi:hypothetical protein
MGGEQHARRQGARFAEALLHQIDRGADEARLGRIVFDLDGRH